jgi:hypothetical protein
MSARARAESAEVLENTRKRVAGTTGLEPATSDVTGRRSKPTELRPRWIGLSVGHPSEYHTAQPGAAAAETLPERLKILPV